MVKTKFRQLRGQYGEAYHQLRAEALTGNTQALQTLLLSCRSIAELVMEIHVSGSPRARMALENAVGQYTSLPWIVSYSDSPDIRKTLREIGLGKKLGYDSESQVKSDRLTVLARQLSARMDLIRSIATARRKGKVPRELRLPMYWRAASRLPPFSRETLPQWWAVISKAFDQEFPNPSSVSWMRALARNGASAKQVRSIIKKRLRQKLLGLAPKPPGALNFFRGVKSLLSGEVSGEVAAPRADLPFYGQPKMT